MSGNGRDDAPDTKRSERPAALTVEPPAEDRFIGRLVESAAAAHKEAAAARRESTRALGEVRRVGANTWTAITAQRKSIEALTDAVGKLTAEVSRLASRVELAERDAEEAKEAAETTGRTHVAAVTARASQLEALEIERAKADQILRAERSKVDLERERVELAKRREVTKAVGAAAAAVFSIAAAVIVGLLSQGCV